MAQHKGLLLGLFMVLIFGFRFFIEFWKENQVEMENKLEYNLGQMLSVPVVITGFILMFKNTGKAIH
jgi:prolipoprotein diacylglyceryltransferase